MELALKNKQLITRTAVFDLLGIAFIYFMPALSHMLAFPLFYADPMRVMIILAMAHTHKYNVIALGLTLPLFSFVVSSHPVLLKSGLISVELLANIILFYMLNAKTKNVAVAAFLSIAASKVLYYALKFFFISAGALQSELFSTPLWIQGIMAVVFSAYLFLVFRGAEK